MSRRSLAVKLATGALALSLLGLAPAAAGASTEDALARQFHAELNAERAARGLGPLALDGAAAAASASWAGHLGSTGRLVHSSGSGRAEIIGMGSRTGLITAAWMDSRAHRDLVVDPAMAGVGIGVRCDGQGRIWVVAQLVRSTPTRAPRSSPDPSVVDAGSGGTCAQPAGGEHLVQRLYAAYLNRPADPEGLGTYLAQLAGGASAADIGAQLAASPEHAARYGALQGRPFIRAAYRNVLGREPDRSGAAHWLEVARREGRSAVLFHLAHSQELGARTGWL